MKGMHDFDARDALLQYCAFERLEFHNLSDSKRWH